MSTLKDKVAIVTGGGRGIGKAIAKKYAQEKALVAIGGRTKNEVKSTAEELSMATHSKVLGLQLDVGSRESVVDFVQSVKGWAGKIDVLVNCAGINKRVPALEFPENDWENIININLNGAYRMCQEVGQDMVKREYGKIINITSLMSHTTFPYQSAYSAAKAGLAQYTKLLAVEWARYGINVNAISPGSIITELNREVLTKKNYQNVILKQTPQKKLGTPEDIAGVAWFLALDESNYITGHILPVDGGFLAGHPQVIPE